jgi:hypothetical protein
MNGYSYFNLMACAIAEEARFQTLGKHARMTRKQFGLDWKINKPWLDGKTIASLCNCGECKFCSIQ